MSFPLRLALFCLAAIGLAFIKSMAEVIADVEFGYARGHLRRILYYATRDACVMIEIACILWLFGLRLAMR